MQDFLFWAVEKVTFGKAAASWRTSVVQPGQLVFRKAVPAEKFFVLGTSLNMMYLWPAVSNRFGKTHTIFGHAVGGIELLQTDVVLDFSEWGVVDWTCISPASAFILNNRIALEELPKYLALATCKEDTMLRVAARTAFIGLPKHVLLKLDSEEV